MDFLHREIKLPFRLSVIISNFVVLVFVSFFLYQITKGVISYRDLRQKGWWPNCPTSTIEDIELPFINPNHPRLVCLEKRGITNFFLNEGVTNLLFFLVLFVLLHLISRQKSASWIICDPRFIFFSWLPIILIYLIVTSHPANYTHFKHFIDFVQHFGGAYSVISLYLLFKNPKIINIWWWLATMLSALFSLVLIVLLHMLATLPPYRL